jgi:ribosomal protein L2
MKQKVSSIREVARQFKINGMNHPFGGGMLSHARRQFQNSFMPVKFFAVTNIQN